jgi:hypothetical protein
MKVEKIDEKKQKFTFHETKTKQNFDIFEVSQKQAKFCKTTFLFGFVSCFAKQKRMRNGNPSPEAIFP